MKAQLLVEFSYYSLEWGEFDTAERYDIHRHWKVTIAVGPIELAGVPEIGESVQVLKDWDYWATVKERKWQADGSLLIRAKAEEDEDEASDEEGESDLWEILTFDEPPKGTIVETELLSVEMAHWAGEEWIDQLDVPRYESPDLWNSSFQMNN